MPGAWQYATLEIAAVQLSTDGHDPGASTDESAEWQIYAIGPSGDLLFEEYRPYRVAWARVYAEHLNRLGRDGWELVGFTAPQGALYPTAHVHATGVYPSIVESRFVLRRPA